MSKVQNKFCQPTDDIVKWVQVLSSSFMPTFGIFFMYGQHRHSFQTAFSRPKTTDFSYRSTHDFLSLSLVITSATPHLPSCCNFGVTIITCTLIRNGSRHQGFVYDLGSVCGLSWENNLDRLCMQLALTAKLACCISPPLRLERERKLASKFVILPDVAYLGCSGVQKMIPLTPRFNQ